MDGESFNFLAVPAALLLGLACAPFALRRAGYPWGKTAFGSLAVAVAGLAVAGIVSAVQRKAGIAQLPLAWIAPLLVGYALVRIARSRAPD
jgi:hypothetical protein